MHTGLRIRNGVKVEHSGETVEDIYTIFTLLTVQSVNVPNESGGHAFDHAFHEVGSR